MATLKNAIERFENNAEFERRNNNLQGCLDFRQLAEWLKDYKRLLEQEPTDKSNLEKICEELAAENDDLRDQLAMRDRFKQEPCDDAVSRQEVLDLVNSDWKYKGLKADIESLPPVRPQEQTGHWIIEDMFDGDVAYRCSECNELFWLESGTPKDNEYNFCPNCGAKMVEPQESEG